MEAMVDEMSQTKNNADKGPSILFKLGLIGVALIASVMFPGLFVLFLGIGMIVLISLIFKPGRTRFSSKIEEEEYHKEMGRLKAQEDSEE